MIELVIDSTRLELMPGEMIILQDSIGRIGNFSEREGQITNDFDIYWTGPNISALGFHDKNTSTSTFPYVKQNAILRQRGVELSKGFVQLVEVDQANRKATVSFYGTNTSPFLALGSDSIRALDFSDLDHDWTEANITGSWTNTDGYIYPCVDPGRWTDSGVGAANTVVTDWRPSVYQKTVISRIFARIGYKISGPWLNEFSYTNAVIPVVRMVESGTANTYSFAQNTVAQFLQYIASPPNPLGDTLNNQLQLNKTNDSLHFDIANDEYTATTTTSEQLEFSAVFDFLKWIVNGPTSAPINIATFVKIYQNSTLIAFDTLTLTVFAGVTPSPLTYNWSKNLSVSVVPGDTVSVEFELDYSSPSSAVTDFQIDVRVSDFQIVAPSLVQDSSLSAGDAIDVAYNLPDISQRNFVLDMIVRHALQITTDNYTKTVTFTPANKVFSNVVNAPDWTEKINHLKISTIDFVEIVQGYGQRTNFLYSNDGNDYVQDAYFQAHDEYFGDGYTMIGNEFLDPETDFYTSQFAATVPRRVFLSDSLANQPVIPCIPYYKGDGGKIPTTEDSQDVVARILLVVPNTSFSDMGGGATLSIAGTSYANTCYAYFSRDKIGTALDVYQDGLAWNTPMIAAPADISLLSRWYRQIVRVWNSPKYITVEARILEYEYQGLDFLTPIFIDTEMISGYFIIDEVEDYDGYLATFRLIQIE